MHLTISQYLNFCTQHKPFTVIIYMQINGIKNKTKAIMLASMI